MCGIAGYKLNRRVDTSVIKKMVRELYHRGPDADGFYTSDSYSAGMRRLRINDLKTGDQPLYNQDRSIALLYNGEIYNSPELRAWLEQKGYKFRTHSDGEVICHLYDEYQEDLFQELDGMFALALWIGREKKLILARDIPGEKPLYYTLLSRNELIFASELKSLVLFPGLDLSLDYQGIWDLPTFLWIPEPATIYKKIHSLPRGHMLICDSNGITLQKYARTDKDYDSAYSDDEVIERTRQTVTRAVQSRLLSDVPVGCFLSSGLDSSIVATLASKALPSLDTFTIGFEDIPDPYHGRADESAYAQEYARRLGSKHHNIHVEAKDFRKTLMDFCTVIDQPFAVSSALGIMTVAKVAHEAGIKVLLSGDCADECFGGYSWYFYLNNKGKGNKTIPCVPQTPVTFNNVGMPLEDCLSVLYSYTPQERAWAWHYYASELEKSLLFNPEVFEGKQSSIRFFYDFKKDAAWEAEDFIRHDRVFYLPNEMLQKLDRMTMAYSVEGRVPFAAPLVLEHADKLRYHHMVKGNYLKWTLRNAFSDILPKEIYERPKHGFNVPVDHWFRTHWNDLFEETFAPSSNLMKMGLITERSLDAARQMVQDKIRMSGHTIFSFVILNQWLGNYMHGNNS